MGKTLFHPLTMALAVAAVGAGLAGQTALAVLAVIFAIASLAYQAMRESRSLRDEGLLEDLSNEDRSKLAPLRRLRKEVSEVVQARASDPSMSVIGTEAIREADRILEQCAKMLLIRRQLRKASSSKGLAERDLASLEAAARSSVESERATLDAAIQARRQEIEHYAKALPALERIDSSLAQAQAALSEMKARLAAHGSDEAAAVPTTDLEETIGRMRSLGTSLEEAEQWLKGQ